MRPPMHGKTRRCSANVAATAITDPLPRVSATASALLTGSTAVGTAACRKA